MALITPTLMAPAVTPIYNLAYLNGELFGYGYDGRLLRWNTLGSWVQVAPAPIGFTGSGYALIAFDGYIWGTSGDGLWRWNGTDAWVLMASNPLSYPYNVGASLCIYNGYLWGSSYDPGGYAKLYRYNNAGSWVAQSGSWNSRWQFTNLHVYNGSIWCVTEYGELLEYNGVSITNRSSMITGSLEGMTSLFEFGSEIYTTYINDFILWKWDGTTVGSWLTVIPDATVRQSTFLFIHDGEIYGISAQASNTPLYKWDGVYPSGSWLEVTDTSVGASFRRGISFNGSIYLTSTTGALYVLQPSPIEAIGIPSLETWGSPTIVNTTVVQSALPPATTDKQGDIRLVLDPLEGYGDVLIDDRDVERDAGFETAVLITIGTDRRAENEDDLPDDGGYRGGYWADELSLVENDKMGCRLWLLRRSKGIDSVIVDAKNYLIEGFQWMIDDGVIEELIVNVYRVDNALLNMGDSVLQMDLQFIRPSREDVFYTFYYNWEAQILRRG